MLSQFFGRDVTQKSLRQAIGVVPQDPVLFNSSIGYNIGCVCASVNVLGHLMYPGIGRYGKFGSSPEEIEAAAKSAQMHERVISFPDGNCSSVGPSGVVLTLLRI